MLPLNAVQVPGVIVMEVASSEAGTADPGLARILTVFNASTKAYTGDWPQQARSLQVPGGSFFAAASLPVLGCSPV
jgi:hypothetical protein